MTTFYDKSTLAIHNKIVPGMVIKWLANLNFSAKMNALTVLMLVFSLGGGLFNAWSARDTVQLALESSLKDQVTGYAAMLSKLQASQDPKSFLSAATALLTGARWGENQSGYLFLVDENSRFVAYPPNQAMVGQSTPRVQINETGHDLSDSLQQVSRTQRPALIHYDYIKPGSSEVEHKASYLMPVGPYVLSAGIYLDAADEAFSGYIKKSLVVVAIIMVGMLLLVQWLSRAIRQQVTLSLAGLRRISERVLDQGIPVWGRDEFALINQELEQTRCQLAELLFHQRNSAQHVAAASMQMDCGVLQVTQAVVEQQGRLNELASAMEQMRASVQDVATQAVHCATETRDTAKSSAEGEKDVNTIIHSIERLCGELKGCAEGIDAVQQQVNSISNMVDIVYA